MEGYALLYIIGLLGIYFGLFRPFKLSEKKYWYKKGYPGYEKIPGKTLNAKKEWLKKYPVDPKDIKQNWK